MAALALLWTPIMAFSACKRDTSPTISENNSEYSAVLPDAEAPPLDEESATSSAPNSSESTPIPQTAQYIRCTGSQVNFRAGAGTQYSVLGRAEQGTSYVVLGKTGGWYKTYYRNEIAYISASYVSVFTMEKADEQTEDVLAQGYKLIGVPYVYGAVRLHDGKGNLLRGFTRRNSIAHLWYSTCFIGVRASCWT